jgi:addiction module HigA family antidote
MPKILAAPTIGDILKEEFMAPLGLSADKVAREIHVPVSYVQGLLCGQRRMTADMALRLAKLFGVSDR